MSEALEHARNIAGHEAMRLVAQHGCDSGEEIIEGFAIAFARALCALKGVNETRKLLDQRLPRPDPERPKLVADES